VDKMAYLKDVNIKLQGKCKLLYDMFSDVNDLLQNDGFFFLKARWLGTDGQTNTVCFKIMLSLALTSLWRRLKFSKLNYTKVPL